MFFLLGRVSGCPLSFINPLYICMPTGVYTPPICSPYCASVCSQRLLHVVGGCKGPPYMLDTSLTHPPVWGASPSVCTPTPFFASLCISMFWGYQYVIWGFFPSVRGLEGVLPSVGGSGGISTWGAHVLILVHFCSSLCLMFLLQL